MKVFPLIIIYFLIQIAILIVSIIFWIWLIWSFKIIYLPTQIILYYIICLMSLLLLSLLLYYLVYKVFFLSLIACDIGYCINLGINFNIHKDQINLIMSKSVSDGECAWCTNSRSVLKQISINSWNIYTSVLKTAKKPRSPLYYTL